MSPEANPNSALQCVVPGDLTSTTAPAFRAEFDRKIAEASNGGVSWDHLEIDLRHARMVDSVGLNQLVSVIKIVKERGASVHLLISHPNIQRILAFTRIDKHAEVKIA